MKRIGMQFLLWRAAWAFLLSCLAFWMTVSPAPYRLLGSNAITLSRVLDAPASALNLIVPEQLHSAVARQFTTEAIEISGGPLAAWVDYMLLSVPAWFAILMTVSAITQRFRFWSTHSGNPISTR
jgi:hypothetical protein